MKTIAIVFLCRLHGSDARLPEQGFQNSLKGRGREATHLSIIL